MGCNYLLTGAGFLNHQYFFWCWSLFCSGKTTTISTFWHVFFKENKKAAVCPKESQVMGDKAIERIYETINSIQNSGMRTWGQENRTTWQGEMVQFEDRKKTETKFRFSCQQKVASRSHLQALGEFFAIEHTQITQNVGVFLEFTREQTLLGWTTRNMGWILVRLWKFYTKTGIVSTFGGMIIVFYQTWLLYSTHTNKYTSILKTPIYTYISTYICIIYINMVTFYTIRSAPKKTWQHLKFTTVGYDHSQVMLPWWSPGSRVSGAGNRVWGEVFFFFWGEICEITLWTQLFFSKNKVSVFFFLRS